MITVREVTVSPDLGLARAYLSLFPVGNKEEMLEQIRMSGKEIRHELATRIRHQVRKIPQLEYFLDESLDYAQRMEEIFQKIREEENKQDPQND